MAAPGGGSLCLRRAVFAALLFAAVGASLFTDWLLAFRLNGGWFAADDSGEDPLGIDPVAKAKVPRSSLPPATSLQKGDRVVARQNFLSDSMQPVVLRAGQRGVVVQVDGEGDAEITFKGLSREWVYHDKFPHLAVEESAPRAYGVVEGAMAQLPVEEAQRVAEPPGQAPPPAVPGGRRRRSPAAAPAPVAEDAALPARPAPKGAAQYKPIIVEKHHECLEQALDVGGPPTVKECDALVAEEPDCGGFFMFAPEHPDWKCRCCTEEGAEGGPKSDQWNVYKVQAPRPAEPGDGDEVSKEKYKPAVHARKQECDEQALDVGFIPSIAKCDAVVAAEPKCGAHFMFSKRHPDWHCRCCTPAGADDGPANPQWDVYAVQAPVPDSRKAALSPAALDPTIGLPVERGPRPEWLLREDALVADGRQPPGGGGGVLILQAVLLDASKGWGKKQGFRPRWLRAILAANRQHARLHGHALVLRVKATEPQLTSWQTRQCGKKTPSQCRKDNERENYNWEKHLMLAEYLNSPQKFSHVMMLDADAAFIRQDHDTVGMITKLLDKQGKDLFLTDEDWLKYGEGRINGGLIVARNSDFTKKLFQDTFDAHVSGPVPVKQWRIGVRGVVCSSNEQICLNDLWKGGRGEIFSDHTMMAGGTKWNHGAESGGFDDPKVEILHFMGGSKGTAGEVLCDGSRDVTGEGPAGYGCKK